VAKKRGKPGPKSRIALNPKVKAQVDALLDGGFTPTVIVMILKENFDLSIHRSAIYNYKNSGEYIEKPFTPGTGVISFKKYGEFLNIAEMKVATVAIFMARIDKALASEAKLPFTSRAVDDSIMRMNDVLDSLYKIYQDMGLKPRTEQIIGIKDETPMEKRPVTPFQTMIAGMTNMQKSELAMSITTKITKAIDDSKIEKQNRK